MVEKIEGLETKIREICLIRRNYGARRNVKGGIGFT